MKIVSKKDDWKFEFIIYLENKPFIKFKLYDKTLEKLTSMGVMQTDPRDPLYYQLGTTKGLECDYKRKLVCSEQGFVISRLEISIFGSKVLLPDVYNLIVGKLIPQTSEYLIKKLWFRKVHISHYWKILFRGQFKFGRVITLIEKKPGVI